MKCRRCLPADASKVKRIVTFDGDLEMAHAPMSVTLTLADEIDISRGDMICVGTAAAMRRASSTRPWSGSTRIRSIRRTIIWSSTPRTWFRRRVDGVRHLMNVATLESEPATSLAMNEIGVVRIATAQADLLRSVSRESGHRELSS